MSDWTSGYVADVDYTYGYYGELNPLRVRLAFLNAGLVPPQIGTACELGFGQGVSTNIHAAASVVQWSGTDFNPSQAAFAQELAAASGAGARLFDEAFEHFCRRADLPDFDYIGVHGIWSWISDANRQVIVDFLRRKLKVGGVLYISYNTLPGWAAMVPMRHLLTEHAEVMGAPGNGIVSRIDAALAFSEKLLQANPIYARANPAVVERMKVLKGQNRHYLAHEYFNRDWLPMHFADMAGTLSAAKLSFACSAHYLDHVDPINLTNEQQALLKEVPDPVFRQTVRDFMVDQQFRRDYWVRGARKMSSFEQAEQLRAQRVVLVTPRAAVTLVAQGSLGKADMQENVYASVLDALADHLPRSIGEIAWVVADRKVSLAQVLQAVMVLAGKGDLAAVQDQDVIGRATPTARKLNARLMNKAYGANDLSYLASPVTGGGITVGRFQQLFMLALAQGKQRPEEWAGLCWGLLVAQSQRLLKDGKPMESDEDNQAELLRQANEFAEKRLPILKILGVAPCVS